MASIFQRGKGKNWWIQYYANGRQVYYSLGTKNERVAKRIKRQIEGEETKIDLIVQSTIPLPALQGSIIKSKLPTASMVTVTSY